MRIAILAGVVALAAPVVADAALYEFSFESGPTEFIGTEADYVTYGFDFEQDFSSYDGVGDPVTASFVVDLNSIENVRYSVGFANGSIYEQEGGSLVTGGIDYTQALSRFTLFGDASFSTNAQGEVIGAGAGIGQDFPDYEVGFETVRWGDGSSNFFEGTGSWTVTALDTPDVAPVPLPATAPLIGIGLAALGWARRRGA